ncbi:MAG: histidine phosphatase family protein [Acidimicrobiia bacterium]|nr:histidine phosphatase family protein [Acidimicrobiia bacterium]
MRTLLVLRHGKSDWDATFGTDEQRPLAKRGKDAAKRIGVFITNAGVEPDICLTSPAVRARDTLDLARKAGHWEASVHENRLLYEGGVSSIINLVRETDRRVSTVLLAGHQPTSSNLVSSLIGGGRIRFPTAGVACIQFTTAWSDIGPNTGELRWFVIPNMLE